MGEEVKKTRRPSLRFNELEIKLILSVMENMEKPLELMYYFLEKDPKKTFVMMLVSAQDVNTEVLLDKEKRDTDLLFSVDEEKNLFALICQETKVDGGYRFAERILKTLISQEAKDIYLIEVEVRNTRYEVKDLIMKSVEKYLIAKKEKRENQIHFHTL
jgi:hypothetical protein